jgi:hypothetical protein
MQNFVDLMRHMLAEYIANDVSETHGVGGCC